MSLVITQAHAEKVIELLGHGLVAGVGEPTPGKMCVEAAICFALGLPHGDDPGCVTPALRRLKIALNDHTWSSPQARARGLRRLALAQLGSRGVLDESEFMRRVVDMTIRKAVPIGLRAAAAMNPNHADALEVAAVRCEQDGTRASVEDAKGVARASYAFAAFAAAYADAAADAFVAADADAATYAAFAAFVAADAFAAAYAATADAARTRDRVFAEYAEWVVEILIDMQAPGCQWLHLAPLEAA